MSILLFLLWSLVSLGTNTMGLIRMDFLSRLLFYGITAFFIDLRRPMCAQYDVLLWVALSYPIGNKFPVAYNYGFILSYSLCFSSYIVSISRLYRAFSLTPLSGILRTYRPTVGFFNSIQWHASRLFLNRPTSCSVTGMSLYVRRLISDYCVDFSQISLLCSIAGM